jgi:acetoin utilization protein AcuB
MWMTKEVATVNPSATLPEIAALLRHKGIRRVPVVDAQKSSRLVGIVSITDLLRACPANLNPLSITAMDDLATQSRHALPTAAELMTRDPCTTAPESPIEAAARLLRDRKIGALPVVSHDKLVGVITESDIFRALVAVFDSAARGARITFDASRGEDVLPLLSDIAKRHGLRVINFISLQSHERPVCVVQVVGERIEPMLEEVWASHHRVISVLRLP